MPIVIVPRDARLDSRTGFDALNRGHIQGQQKPSCTRLNGWENSQEVR